MNFCPRPNHYNKNSLNTDMLSFYRTVKLRAHFKDKEQTKPPGPKLKSNSKWTPSKVSPCVETFITAVNNEINDSNNKHLPKDNLSKNERKSLKQLKDREDIIITKADKGGAVVILNTEDYIKEANRQLNDESAYKQLNDDPTESHTEKVINTINNLKEQNLLSDSTAKKLIPDHVKTPNFYLLPKVHKENHLGRPVISSVSCHTSAISTLVDYHLQPYVKQLKSYVKDTTDFINKIEHLPPTVKESFLVSMDVRSLYTNIPHKEGIEAVKLSLNRKPSTVSNIVLLMFLNLILTLNNFIFNGLHYLQTKGCAMGTKCAPCYANIFMGNFEEHRIYPKIRNLAHTYLRYIDDIFMIWTGTKEQFLTFIEDLNKCHPTIKFDFEISPSEINFLDTTVYKDKNNILRTKLYTKSTDRHNYLHRKSEHPESLKKSIPYSQALRINKICYDKNDRERNYKELQKSFIDRGYEKEFIEKEIKKAGDIPRNNLLENKERKQSNRLPLITTYNRTLPNLKHIVKNNWDILTIDRELRETFKEPPIIAYRRNKNLRDMIGGNTIINNKKVIKQSTKRQIGKCEPCFSRENNLCCQQILTTSTFQSNQNGKIYNILHNVNCKTENCIYLMECTICPYAQYIGKAEGPLNIRINQHRYDVRRPTGPPCDKHFLKSGHNFNRHAKFTVIEKIENIPSSKIELTKLLEHKEDIWMLRLETIAPKGLNIGLNYPQHTTGSLM